MHCTYDPATRGGDAPDGRRVKATIHWVSAQHALPAEIRLYDRLFTVENPDSDSFKEYLNPNSLEVLNSFVEPSMANAKAGLYPAIRTPGLLLRRPGQHRREAGHQPHRPVER